MNNESSNPEFGQGPHGPGPAGQQGGYPGGNQQWSGPNYGGPQGPGPSNGWVPPAGSDPRNGNHGGRAFFDTMRRSGFFRSEERWVGGVAGGLARRLNVDPLIVRVIILIICLSTGIGVLAYAAAWALLPEERDGRIHAEEMIRGNFDGALIGIAIAALIGLGGVGGFVFGIVDVPWPLTTIFWLGICALVFYLIMQVKESRVASRKNQQWQGRPPAGPHNGFGPNGPQGPFGPQGPQGPYGPSAPQGPSGYPGAQGFSTQGFNGQTSNSQQGASGFDPKAGGSETDGGPDSVKASEAADAEASNASNSSEATETLNTTTPLAEPTEPTDESPVTEPTDDTITFASTSNEHEVTVTEVIDQVPATEAIGIASYETDSNSNASSVGTEPESSTILMDQQDTMTQSDTQYTAPVPPAAQYIVPAPAPARTAGANYAQEWSAPQTKRPPVKNPGATQFATLLGLSFLTAMGLFIADRTGNLAADVNVWGLTAGIAIVLGGLAVIYNGFRGWSSGSGGLFAILSVIGALILGVLFFPKWVTTSNFQTFSDQTFSPTSIVQVENGYSFGMGDMTVDLTGLPFSDLAGNTEPLVIPIHGGMGDIDVLVPAGVAVTANTDMGIGSVNHHTEGTGSGENSGGIGNSIQYSSQAAKDGQPVVLHLDINMGVGDVTITEVAS